jgi:hypothetical protein
MEKNLKETYVFNTILVHASRTWERVRVKEMPHQEMPYDNIESVDIIVSVADSIMNTDIIKKFIESNNDWCWRRDANVGCSDEFIESKAYEIIRSIIES